MSEVEHRGWIGQYKVTGIKGKPEIAKGDFVEFSAKGRGFVINSTAAGSWWHTRPATLQNGTLTGSLPDGGAFEISRKAGGVVCGINPNANIGPDDDSWTAEDYPESF